MKFTIITIIWSVLFLSCTQKKNTFSLNTINQIDSLTASANNLALPTNYRLEKADEAVHLLQKFDSKIQQYIDLGIVYYNLGERVKYFNLFKELHKKSIANNDFVGIAESSYSIGNYYYHESKYDSAYQYFLKSEKYFLKSNNNIARSSFSKNIRATILTFKKDYVGAEKLAVEALINAKAEDYNLLVYHCYITLGNSLEGLNNYNKSIEYYTKANQTVKRLTEDPQYPILKAMPYNYIANVYIKNKKYESAITTAETALNFFNYRKIDADIYCYLINTIGYAKLKTQDKDALKLLLEAFTVGKNIKSIPIEITSSTHLGEYYLIYGDTIKANYYLKKAAFKAHKNNIFEDELKILNLLARANPTEKLKFSERYMVLTDSLNRIERATRDKYAIIEFETREITAERNKLMLERENISLQRWIIISVASLSIIILIMWFRNKSQKSKYRELILEQNQLKINEDIYELILTQQQKINEGRNLEKQRISLELHDGVMGRLSAVRLNFYAQLYKENLANNNQLISQLDEIQIVEKEIRNIAHDLNSNLFADNSNFISIVQGLFLNFKNHSTINFDLNVSPAINFDLISSKVKINIYRIIQEALNNIQKYSEAEKVKITMSLIHDNEIKIIIADNGRGFDTESSSEGIGIKNMKIRISELQGKINIKSKINDGTEIYLIIPI